MWARLSDELLDHPKIFIAGAALGKDGAGLALGFYVVGLLWATRHLSDGFLPLAVVKAFPHVAHPLAVAAALVHARLWEAADDGSGFQIHDFDHYNLRASEVRARQEWTRRRKELTRDLELLDAIIDRDADHCRYCGVTVDWTDRRGPTGAQFDHVIPKGPNTFDNVVVACATCNMRKSGRTPADAQMTLLPPPDNH